MYSCDGDWLLFLKILNAVQIFMAAIVVSWTRHEPPEEISEYVMSQPVVRIVHTDGAYFQEAYLSDMLTTREADILREMILAGNPITFRSAQVRGVTRANWNKARDAMVSMKLASMTDGGRLVLMLAAYHYLGIGRPSTPLSP